MGSEILERDDLSVYVVAGVPKSFKKKLQELVEEEAKKSDGQVLLVDESLAEWVLSKLADEKRPRASRTPASKALWRAFSALSAARYHLQHTEEEERVRELRQRVEELWRETSPMFAAEPLPPSDVADPADASDASDASDD